eukprot:scaffold27928_cov16-Tisochrysis_lutea.AAC.1
MDGCWSKLASECVEPLLLVSSSGAPSASCLCLVTPDGQRTMRTCLGASLELKTAEQIPSRRASISNVTICQMPGRALNLYLLA